MDLLQEIKKKSELLQGHKSLEGLNAVVKHIEVAERYLQRGRSSQEEDFFNDVIYRTNQAFEGILKEAYSVLTSKEVENLSPYKIEEHLLKENTLASRVLDLFKNYRQNWRNPSTHDHRLFFSEQEALLAIVSISAFAIILTDQIIEAVNFQREQQELILKKEKLQKAIQNNAANPFPEQIIELIKLFNNELINTNLENRELLEIEIIGRLNGFIEGVAPDVKVERQPKLTEFHSSTARPDLILKKNGEGIIVEIKRLNFNKISPIENRILLINGIHQLTGYLGATNLETGILYIPSLINGTSKLLTEQIVGLDKDLTIHSIIPEDYLD